MTSAPAARVLDELRMAFLTLSRLPVGRIRGEAPAMGASAWAWPLVGATIGLIAAIVDCAALRAGLPPFLAAALAILALVLATGGLHEDGLADLADGFWGGRDAARRLEIMRDSRIGSYGALALGFSLLIRVGALASLPHGMGGAALVVFVEDLLDHPGLLCRPVSFAQTVDNAFFVVANDFKLEHFYT